MRLTDPTSQSDDHPRHLRDVHGYKDHGQWCTELRVISADSLEATIPLEPASSIVLGDDPPILLPFLIALPHLGAPLVHRAIVRLGSSEVSGELQPLPPLARKVVPVVV